MNITVLQRENISKKIPQLGTIRPTRYVFSLWDDLNGVAEEPPTKKAKQTVCAARHRRWTAGFGGHPLQLDPLDENNCGFGIMVPGSMMFQLLAAFKTQPNEAEHRKTMLPINSATGAYYTMFDWSKGKREVKVVDWRDNPLLKNSTVYSIEGFLSSIQNALNLFNPIATAYEQPKVGLVKTEAPIHQRPHLDVPGCTHLPEHKRAYIVHLPLCEEGLALQIWDGEGKELRPTLLYVPFGMALILRSDVVHAGCYGHPGNIRFHAVLKPELMVDDGSKLEYIWNQEKYLLSNSMMDPTHVLPSLRSQKHGEFSTMYIERLKQTFPSPSFWLQKVFSNMPATKGKNDSPDASVIIK
jgi:hypothetical protein